MPEPEDILDTAVNFVNSLRRDESVSGITSSTLLFAGDIISTKKLSRIISFTFFFLLIIFSSEIVENRTNIEIPQTSAMISLVTSQIGDIEDAVTRGLVFHEKNF